MSTSLNGTASAGCRPFQAIFITNGDLALKDRETRVATLAATILIGVMIGALLALPGLKRRGQSSFGTFLLPLPSTVEAAGPSPWKQAVEKIKEDRGEPTGKQAEVAIPAQLRHYGDTRRFLAIQVAEWREHRFETPHDFVDLARLISEGQMEELKSVSENYILFGVGGRADTEPFTHYEKSSGKRIPLYSEAELAREYARIDVSLTSLDDEIDGLRQELNSAGKRERSKRKKLQAQINGKEKAVKAEHERKEQLDSYYGDTERRQQLFAHHAMLENLGKNFPGQTYDISDAHSRQEMKLRMLSSLRPEAVKVLEEVAISYRQKFDRQLPITSLVRPDEYQHLLSKVNPNATMIETPPHSTGLAFDIYYKYMTAEEQSHVMNDLARLEDEGRIEVLRENRDHYHVFAFVDGARPDETLISESLGKTASKAPKETKIKEKVVKKEEKKVVRKVAQKESVKKPHKVKGKRR